MTVLIEHKSGYTLGTEELLVEQTLKSQGKSYSIAGLSQLERGRVRSIDSSLVVGTLPFIKAALRERGLIMAMENTYPQSLMPFMHRNVWRERLSHALDRAEMGRKCFTKPSERAKRFTGLVLESGSDWRVGGVPRSEPVWSSDLVTWRSEWRVYVRNNEIAFCGHYSGDKGIEPDYFQVSIMMAAYSAANVGHGSYAMDVGVLECGQTALVEMNDGFAIGAYDQIPGDVYLEFLQSRWNEMTYRTENPEQRQ